MFAHRKGKKKKNYIEKVIKNICHEQNDISITIKWNENEEKEINEGFVTSK